MRPFFQTAAGIDWYCEQRGRGPHVVLIPSGEGDCASFDKVAADLAPSFTVTTFDTPGFSRTSAPGDSEKISIGNLAGQIAALIKSLGIRQASFYGCSSGGVAALDLLLDYPAIVRNVIIHEAAITSDNGDTGASSPLLGLAALDDASIAVACADLYGNMMNADLAAWNALGPDFHARLRKNYVTWLRRYVAGDNPRRNYDPAVLRGKAIAWTLGGHSQVMPFFSNIRLCIRSGIDMEVLMCKHFPQVSIPTQLAEHIAAKIELHV